MTQVLCVGTATEIGKTWVGAAALAEAARRGASVAARKPVQSFDPTEPGPTDADVLAAATGEHPNDVCPGHRWYPVPMAPPMAAALLGRDAFSIADLENEVVWPAPVPDVCWVETVGGVRSPIAFDGDSVDLCGPLSADVVILVADAGLGTINSVRLSAAALPSPLLVHLNRYDDDNELHRLNRAWLDERDGFRVTVTIDDLVTNVLRR